jgi:hypothetical protein
MQIESFSTSPLKQAIPSYLFAEYSDDENLQAFVDAYNSITQGYVSWFNNAPLGLYTSPYITGSLLDWIGNGVYGIARPVLASTATLRLAGYDENAYNTISYNGLYFSSNQTASIANDDIYKRVMTWILYRGDGQMFTIGWVKNRINRFLNGANGGDYPVLNFPPSVTVSGTTFTVTSYNSTAYSALQLCYANGALTFPFQYTLNFVTDSFINDGGVLYLPISLTYPTSPMGLVAGSAWWNGGVISVIPGHTPNPSAAPLYFQYTFPQQLLSMGGGDLPISNPGVGTGQLWNNGGVVSIA